MKSIKGELKRALYFSTILPVVFIFFAVIILLIIRNMTEGAGGSSDFGSGNPPDAVKLFGIIVIAGVVSIALLLNYINTKNLLKRIQTPLDVLEKTVSSIGAGNYDIKINYQTEDEFKGICDSLDLMSAQLQDAIMKYENLESARRDFLVGISHDLRTPLTAIRGYVSGVQDGVAITPQKQGDYLSKIDVKVEELEYLIQQIFFLSKLEATQYPFEMEIMEAHLLLQSMFEELQVQFNNSNIETSIQNDIKVNTKLLVDTRELFRVFLNIFENAHKYTQVENTKIAVSLTEIENIIQIEIQDNGIGVSERSLAHLFEDGFREDASREKSADSNGFGLSIANLIIKSHNGTIAATNNHGLKITIKLPKGGD